MKKILMLLAVAAMVCSTAMAQEPQTEKKKGGFMKALKKGVESTTGIKVSDETLFVYPTLADWKFTVDTCAGNTATGEVKLILSGMKLSLESETGLNNVYCTLLEATVSGQATKLKIEPIGTDPMYNFMPNKSTLVPFPLILNVPKETKSIDVKFRVNSGQYIIEGRRIPIVWE